MHFYTHNIGEFAIDTKFMSFEEKGIYVELVDRYLATGKPLASEWLATIKRFTSDGAVKAVLATCFVRDGDVYRSERLDRMIEDYEIRAEKNRENARKPRKKAEKSMVEENLATGKQIASESLTTNNYKPITKNQKEEEEESAVAPEPMPAKEVRKRLSSPSRGTQFGLDSMPDDWRDYAETTCPDLDSSKLFEEFSDYWKGVPGEKGRKKDWFATWRNHLRNLPVWKQDLFAKQGTKTADKGFAFGKVSDKYARVLASKLADTRDPALSSISYGVHDWRDAADHYARMMLESERGFEVVKNFLVKHHLVEA